MTGTAPQLCVINATQSIERMYLCRFSAGAFYLRMENCNSLRVIGQTALLMDKNVEKHLSDTYAAQGIKVHL